MSFEWYDYLKDTMTPPKFKIAPEKLLCQKESSIPTIIFQGYVDVELPGSSESCNH